MCMPYREKKDSWKEVKTSVLTGIRKQLAAAGSSLVGDFEGPKLQKRKTLAVHVVGGPRELEFELEGELGGRVLTQNRPRV